MIDDEEELDGGPAPAEDRPELEEPEDAIDEELGERDHWVDLDELWDEADDPDDLEEDPDDAAAMAELDALDIDWDEPIGAPNPHLGLDPEPDPTGEDEVAA